MNKLTKLFEAKKLAEDTKPLTLYEKGKKYLASYINDKGEQVDIEYTPEEPINIVELINKLKEEHKDFYRLYGVVEAKTESIMNELEINNEDTVLTEDVNIQEEITPDNFKQYVQNGLVNNSEYIKLIKSDKQNIHQQWGTHIYCYDYEVEDDGVPIEGPVYYIPFSTNKKFIDDMLKVTNKNIEKIYSDSTDLFKD